MAVEIDIKIREGNEGVNEVLKEFGLHETPTLMVHTAIVKENATKQGYPSVILVARNKSGECFMMETTARIFCGVAAAAKGAAFKAGLFDI